MKRHLQRERGSAFTDWNYLDKPLIDAFSSYSIEELNSILSALDKIYSACRVAGSSPGKCKLSAIKLRLECAIHKKETP